MKKVILIAISVAIFFSLSACTNYDREQYRSDVIELKDSILNESKNLNYVHDYMNGYWIAVGNEYGMIDDADSMVASALEYGTGNDDDWDMVETTSKINDMYISISDISVVGADKEIKAIIDYMCKEHCQLAKLILHPTGTRTAWNNEVSQSIDKINGASEKLLELINS